MVTGPCVGGTNGEGVSVGSTMTGMVLVGVGKKRVGNGVKVGGMMICVPAKTVGDGGIGTTPTVLQTPSCVTKAALTQPTEPAAITCSHERSRFVPTTGSSAPSARLPMLG